MTLETQRSCRIDENFTLVWKISESIGVKIKCWIAETDFFSPRCSCGRQQPSTRLQAVGGETKTPVLLVRHQNQRITIESTPLSLLWTRVRFFRARKSPPPKSEGARTPVLIEIHFHNDQLCNRKPLLSHWAYQVSK